MGTMSEEILSGHVGKKVKAGDIIVAPVDFMMSQDGTTGLTIKAFNDMNGKKILDPSRYAIVIDHNAPSPIPAGVPAASCCRARCPARSIRRPAAASIPAAPT